MKAMILAAGFGKRLKPLTNDTPKPMLKVGNQSLIERNVHSLINSGFDEIVINVSYLGNILIKHVLNTSACSKWFRLFRKENIIIGKEIQNMLDKYIS